MFQSIWDSLLSPDAKLAFLPVTLGFQQLMSATACPSPALEFTAPHPRHGG